MSNKTKRFWFAAIIFFVMVIQLIPSEQPKVIKNNPDDFLSTGNIPKDVAKMLHESCYNCHSNETVYPWYSAIAPVSWLVNSDVKEGREKLNFSNWTQLKASKKAKSLDKIAKEIRKGEMPLFIYPIMHKNARLSQQNRKRLSSWIDNFANKLSGI